MIVPMKKSGFTLIEIVVVIGIMAILTIIVYGSFGGARTESRDNQRVTDIHVLQLALEEYFNQNHQYPTALSALIPQYTNSIPTPPNGGAYNYFPLTRASGSTVCTLYQLSVTLENSNSYLQSKRGFDSTSAGLATGNNFECGTGHVGINALTGTLIYDVMPQ